MLIDNVKHFTSLEVVFLEHIIGDAIDTSKAIDVGDQEFAITYMFANSNLNSSTYGVNFGDVEINASVLCCGDGTSRLQKCSVSYKDDIIFGYDASGAEHTVEFYNSNRPFLPKMVDIVPTDQQFFNFCMLAYLYSKSPKNPLFFNPDNRKNLSQKDLDDPQSGTIEHVFKWGVAF